MNFTFMTFMGVDPIVHLVRTNQSCGLSRNCPAINVTIYFTEGSHMFVFDRTAIFNLFLVGWIVDGRGGGLVVGRPGGDHIVMVRVLSQDQFPIVGRLAGGEFILNHNAYLNATDRVNEINKFLDEHDPIQNINISPRARLLNTHAEPNDKLLLVTFLLPVFQNSTELHGHFYRSARVGRRSSAWI
jgi:hypothetical protein